MSKINGATFFSCKSEKKTDEGHLKQMREGLRDTNLIPDNVLHLKTSVDEDQLTSEEGSKLFSVQHTSS